jgi:hypothetical protein
MIISIIPHVAHRQGSNPLKDSGWLTDLEYLQLRTTFFALEIQ